MQLYKKTASELSLMLKDKECSSKELAESVFSRIDAAESKVEAFVTICREEALKKAEEVDNKRAKGEELDDLAGIPIAIKDNISTKGILTTCSSKMLSNYIPPFDAAVVKSLKSKDVIITGKVNMDEFAMGSSTETSYFKKTKNPYDLNCVPGGSSGGSAACVASGESILALGSDTGGSIREPASFCGVVGLKPTYGSVSRYGLVAFASSLDQIGPFAKSVEDAAMLYCAICGYDRMDATSAKRSYPDFRKNLNPDMNGKVIGIPDEYFSLSIDDEVRTAVENAIKIYEGLGAKIKRISLPSTKYALAAYYIISSAEASSNLARFDGVKYGYRAKEFANLEEMYLNTRTEGFGDEVKRRIMLGTFVLSSGYYDAYYGKAKMIQRKIAEEFNESFKECDFIITPTVPTTAFKIGENVDDPLKMYATDVCTVTINIAGLPAMSVPCGKDSKGLPIGMQLIGAKFSEQKLFDAAYAFEKAYGRVEMPEL